MTSKKSTCYCSTANEASLFEEHLKAIPQVKEYDPMNIAALSTKIDNSSNSFNESHCECDAEENDIFSWDDVSLIDEEKSTFMAMNESGELAECKTILTFEHAGTQNTYIVYTDGSKAADEKNRIFASIYKNDRTLAPIETAEEWGIIEKLLNNIKKKLSYICR